MICWFHIRCSTHSSFKWTHSHNSERWRGRNNWILFVTHSRILFSWKDNRAQRLTIPRGERMAWHTHSIVCKQESASIILRSVLLSGSRQWDIVHNDHMQDKPTIAKISRATNPKPGISSHIVPTQSVLTLTMLTLSSSDRYHTTHRQHDLALPIPTFVTQAAQIVSAEAKAVKAPHSTVSPYGSRHLNDAIGHVLSFVGPPGTRGTSLGH